MRSLVLTALAVLVALPAQAGQRMDAALTQATIDAAGAELVRQGRVTVPAGTSVVEIPGLAAGLDQDSLRVVVQGAGVRIDRVSTTHVPAKQAAESRRARLQGQIEQLEEARRDARDGVAAAQIELTAIRTLAESADQLTDRDGDWGAMARKLAGSTREALQRQARAERRIARIDRSLERLRSELTQIGGGPGRSRVEVGLQAESAGPVDLRVIYRVHGARWQPVYDANLDTQAGDLRIVRRARVSQSTGIDWEGVELKLSTKRPHQRREVRVPGSWRVGLAPPEAKAHQGGVMFMRESAAMSGDRARGSAPAAITGSPVAVRYQVAGPVDVPSDTGGQNVRLRTQEISADVVRRIVPKKSEAAYIVARGRNTAAPALLPGRVNLYLDGAFTGRGQMGFTARGGELELGFGRDPGIEVSRAVLDDTAGESGIRYLNGRATRERAYRTEIVNRHETPVDVRVIERMPVAGHEDIDVDVLDGTPRPDSRAFDERPGILAWRMTLQPGAAMVLPFGYEVSWPRGESVPGL